MIKSPFDKLFYTLYKCLECHSNFFDLQENPVQLENLYNDHQKKLNLPKKFTPNRYWQSQVDLIQKLRPQIYSVLDIGCRTGDFLMHWPEEIEKVGVELALESARIASERGINVHNSFIEEIDFGDKKFDVITCYAVLEHIENPLSLIDKLTSLTKPNGLIVIMIPSMENIKAQFLYSIHYRWHMFSPPQHLNFYSKQFLDKYMKKKIFKLENRIYTSGGMFNPFAKAPVFNRVFSRIMFIIDHYTLFNKIPIFDHMYSYYLKK